MLMLTAVPGDRRRRPRRVGDSAGGVPRGQARLRRGHREQGLRRDLGTGLRGAVPGPDAARPGRAAHPYYGTAHNSLGNYVAQISGQGPEPVDAGRLPGVLRFVGSRTVAPRAGRGPRLRLPGRGGSRRRPADRQGLTWKGYMEDMGTPCRHPALDTADDTQKAKVGDQYAARHDPFVYFHSIIDSPACAAHDVDLAGCRRDLARWRRPRTSPTSRRTCATTGTTGLRRRAARRAGQRRHLAEQLGAADPGLARVPAGRGAGDHRPTSPTGRRATAAACCGEGARVRTPRSRASPASAAAGSERWCCRRWTRPGTSSGTPYNHYSLLASVEDVFGLRKLG